MGGEVTGRMRDMAVPEADTAVHGADTAVAVTPAVTDPLTVPVRLAAVFLPAPLPRHGRVAFWDPDSDKPPPGTP
jgi:hypothetical protein